MRSKYNMGIRGVKIHRCPKCGSQVEKEGGCPMMSCAICHHGWCWSCGFSDEHWFHELFEGGCAIINTCCFGFDGDDSSCDCSELHWSLRFLMLFLFVLIFIPVMAIGIGLAIGLSPLYCIGLGFISIYFVGEITYRKRYRCLFIVMIPLYPAQFVLVIALSQAMILITIPLMVVSGILLILFYILRVVYQWCAPKKSN
jgi:hypothetical protein